MASMNDSENEDISGVIDNLRKENAIISSRLADLKEKIEKLQLMFAENTV